MKQAWRSEKDFTQSAEEAEKWGKTKQFFQKNSTNENNKIRSRIIAGWKIEGGY